MEMNKLGLVIAALAFAGCATTGNNTPVSPIAQGDDFPARISGDSLEHATAANYRAVRSTNQAVEAEVRYCVEPSGKVTDAAIVKPSGLRSFDAAVVDTVSDWRYESYTDASINKCKQIKVVYDAG
jgi:TonB family protein